MKMFPSLPVSASSLFVTLLLAPWAIATTYFNIKQPQAGSQWQNGAANSAQWVKGLLDGIQRFDIEMGRLSVDGILFVAMDVPATYTALNIYLDSVPTGDDYYMTFMNHTHGVTYAISPQFAVVNTVSSGSQPSPVASAPTVTVSGAPNPTATFATTFPITNVAVSVLGRGWASTALTVVCGVATGALLVFV